MGSLAKRVLVLPLLLAFGASAISPTPATASSEVSFEQVLANPDDLELNLRYARQQARTGRLEQSAGALERILLLEPEWDSARLFYAIVLYRLNDLKGSKRELLILRDRELNAQQQAEVARYLSRVTAADKGTRLTGAVSMGARVDSNPGRASAEAVGLAGGTPVTLTVDERVDAAFSASSHLRLEHDLKTGQGDYLFAQMNGWLTEYGRVDTADYLAGRLKAGAVLFHGDTRITPYLKASGVGLAHEHFFDEYAGGVEVARGITPQVEVYGKTVVAYQDFHVTTQSAVGDARDGTLYTAGAGVKLRPTEADTIKFGGYYLRKDARSASFSYEGAEISLRYLKLLGKGIYLVVDGLYRHVEYDAADPRYSPTIIRQDDFFYGRLGVGAPLSTLGTAIGLQLPDSLADVNLQIAGGFSTQDSTIPNLDIRNWFGELLLTKRFAF